MFSCYVTSSYIHPYISLALDEVEPNWATSSGIFSFWNSTKEHEKGIPTHSGKFNLKENFNYMGALEHGFGNFSLIIIFIMPGRVCHRWPFHKCIHDTVLHSWVPYTLSWSGVPHFLLILYFISMVLLRMALLYIHNIGKTRHPFSCLLKIVPLLRLTICKAANILDLWVWFIWTNRDI